MVAIPERGILSVTVPGVLHGWIQALERYETLTLSDVFEDAIYYAENGFSVTEPRIRLIQGLEVYLEDGISEKMGEALKEKGHRILSEDAAINQVGGGQALYLDGDHDVLLGASNLRKDGCAIGY